MKTLKNLQDKEEIATRLGRIRANSERKWGKMSCHGMVCHLSDSFLGVMGEKTVTPARSFGHRAIKWIALYAPVQWPHGVKTRPEMDQEVGGTRPTDFETDVKRLRALLDRFAANPAAMAGRKHPIFMAMSEEDWMRWGYLHMDHHFRQFGA